jgi:hypothetical protein
MNPVFETFLLKSTNAAHCREVQVIQTLWSGYGKISRVELSGSRHKTVVVKHIVLHQQNNHPRGWNTHNSHQRKVKSYEVETQWYKQYSVQCAKACKVPNFLGAFQDGDDQWIVMEDLDAHFPSRLEDVSLKEVQLCLQWLANFHATFLNRKPDGLWDVGTYWHLATRPDELDKMEHPALKAKAQHIDETLTNCRYKSFVHGDAKLANFCFSANGEAVAAVDFQYVGGGCGMKDVAYFLGSCLTSEECDLYESELLNYYFAELQKVVSSGGAEVTFSRLEDEWRKMYPIACADFTRFLLGWMPSHRKVNAYNLEKMNGVLASV